MNMDAVTTKIAAPQKARRHPVITEEVKMPPRSKLYCLIPLGLGTVEVESLTSSMNRLAWTYRVSSWILVVQELLPCYNGPYSFGSSPHQLGGFGRTRAMRLNGTGEVARAWAKTLEQLTMRSDLHLLTADPWASGLPNWGFLRPAPAWCPACYQQWQEQGQPLYQPLLWTLQVVTVCLHHRQPLIEQCPFCQKKQSAIGAKTAPGYCTQCAAWLGSKPRSEQSCEEDLLDWQRWTKQVVEELILAHRMFGSLPWHMLPIGINACVEAVGGTRQLGRIAGVPNVLFSTWRKQKRTPSFTYLLKVSYALDLSPLQFMTVEPERLKDTLRARMVYRFPPHVGLPAPASKGDLDSMQVFLQSILEGEVGPLPLRHVANQLGVGEKFLAGRFPHECAQITAQYQTYRTEQAKQRVMKECDEVQQVMYALHEQGTTPTLASVAARLSNPHIIRRPEAQARWRAIQHKLKNTQE